MNFLSQVKGGVDPIDLIRVSPLPEFLNQRAFKSQLDDVFGTAIKNKDKEALKIISEIQQYLPQELGGITTGGKVKNYVVEPLDPNRSLTQQQAKTKQVYNRVLKFIDDPKVGELLQKIGINPETAFQALRGSAQLIRKNIPGFINSFRKILKNNPELRVELGDEFSEIENQYASASMMSDVSPQPKKEMGIPAEAIPATAAAAYKFGKPALKTAFKIARPFGTPLTGLGLGVTELMSEDPNYGVAGADFLLPELVKKTAGQAPKGFMSQVLGLQGLEKAAKYGRIGKGIASLARIPSMMTPVGLGLMGIEGVRMGMREQDRINEMRMNEPDKYEEYLDELESYGDFSA